MSYESSQYRASFNTAIKSTVPFRNIMQHTSKAQNNTRVLHFAFCVLLVFALLFLCRPGIGTPSITPPGGGIERYIPLHVDRDERDSTLKTKIYFQSGRRADLDTSALAAKKPQHTGSWGNTSYNTHIRFQGINPRSRIDTLGCSSFHPPPYQFGLRLRVSCCFLSIDQHTLHNLPVGGIERYMPLHINRDERFHKIYFQSGPRADLDTSASPRASYTGSFLDTIH